MIVVIVIELGGEGRTAVRTRIAHFHRGFLRRQTLFFVLFFLLIRYGSETFISEVFEHKIHQGGPGLDPNLQNPVFAIFAAKRTTQLNCTQH